MNSLLNSASDLKVHIFAVLWLMLFGKIILGYRLPLCFTVWEAMGKDFFFRVVSIVCWVVPNTQGSLCMTPRALYANV